MTWYRLLAMRLTIEELPLRAFCLVSVPLVLISTGSARAEESSDLMLDPSPWVSPRAGGVGGALSNSADNIDAFYYNPAGIAGQTYNGSANKEPFVRQVLFPRAGLTLNEAAIKTNQEFTSNGAKTDAQIGAASIKAHEGERHYMRASFIPVGLFMGPIGVVPVMDQQLAAVPKDTDNSDVEFRYRTLSGLMIGSALTEPKGYLSLGASATMGTLEETTATSPYEDLVDATKRAEILSSNKKTYNANSMNLGAMIRFPKKINPTIAIVARDMGNTKNTPTKSGESSLVTKEDLTLGFGIAPSVGKVGRFNLNAEGARLTDTDAPSRKKYRIGTEFTLGSQEGSRALLGLRTGYNSGGVSYGAHLNLGLISVEIASQAVDIGGMDSPVVERRTSGVVYIDVGSF